MPVQPRRDFMKNAAALGIMTVIAPNLLNAGSSSKKPPGNGKGYTILFQGDSITDGGRGRTEDWNHVLGQDYAYLISGRLWYDYPEKNFHFFNREISGNKITDLTERWQEDTLNLKPDLLSILIGINDVSAFLNGDDNFTVETYENGYRSLLQQTKQQLPAIELVLCEPFILPVGKVKEKWKEYSAEIHSRQSVVKKLSREFNAVYVEFQNAFNIALKRAPAEYWIWDGIHPMPAGHEMMAKEWIQQVSKKLNFIDHA